MGRLWFSIRTLVTTLLLVALTTGAGALAAETPTFTVNSPLDDPDRSGGNGRCETAARECTLRAAITEANGRPGPDLIAFDIPETANRGLTGDYYDNVDFTGNTVRRTDATVDFDWGSGSPHSSIGADTFSVRWTGQVEPEFSETYNFYTTSDDGVRLWVNGQRIINNWTNHSPTEDRGQIALEAGQKYNIRMDYYENTGGAAAKLSWSSPSQSKQIIPSGRLYPAQTDSNGVRTIQLSRELPALVDDGTTIDGYTQPGSAPNTDPLASNAAIKIEVRGNGRSTHHGMRIRSSDNVIRGLALYNLRASLNMDGFRRPEDADRNRIVGNFIGTNADGTFRHTSSASFAHGVVAQNGASENRIGEATPADRNVISGNASVAVFTVHPESDRNVIMNNIIGLSPDGTRAVPNRYGIDVNFDSSENIIGGDGEYERNVISGNFNEAVEISHDPRTMNNRTIGNFLGTDLTGTRVFDYTRNGTYGIQLQDEAQSNVFRHNVVGGNRRGGVSIIGAVAPNGSINFTVDNVFEENWIGVTRDGSPIPNLGPGVYITNHAARNRIGPNNVIAHNGRNGVEITGQANNDFNTVTQNSIYANTGLGIDLGPLKKVNLNDGGDADIGANDQLNFPVLRVATTSEVRGQACTGCTVEVFAVEGSTGTHGQGKTFLGSAVVETDGTFFVPVDGISDGSTVTSTATDPQGNTSEFSANLSVSDTLASDTFGRSVTDGWGSAETGGPYNHSGAADFDVAGSTGLVTVPGAVVERGAILPEVSDKNTDALVKVRTNKVAEGGTQQISLVARRSSGNEYRGKLVFRPDGSVGLHAGRVVAGKFTGLSPEVAVPGLTHQASAWYWVRVRVVGANPTSIMIKAWPEGELEPTDWQFSVADDEPTLQGAGTTGIRAFLGANTSNGPVQFSFDDYSVKNAK